MDYLHKCIEDARRHHLAQHAGVEKTSLIDNATHWINSALDKTRAASRCTEWWGRTN